MFDLKETEYGPRLAYVITESFNGLFLLGRRSVLALIGIAVGCASIVALMNVGENATAEAMQIFKGMGTDTISINVRNRPGLRSLALADIDIKSMRSVSKNIISLVPVILNSSTIYSGVDKSQATVVGSSDEIHQALGQSFAAGRALTKYDQRSTYVVVGSGPAQSLSVTAGDQIQIEGYMFTIIGVAARQAVNPLIPFDSNEAIIMHSDSLSRLRVKPEVSEFIITVSNPQYVQNDAELLRKYLLSLSPDLIVEFQIPQQLLEGMERQAKNFSYLLIALGGISLFIGGIGVMNVMVMSVSERRKEIGTRVAIGARTTDIRNLFIFEAAILSITGATLGVVFGVLFAYLFSIAAGWVFRFSIMAIPLGVASSLIVGIVFGIQPALSAARLTPAWSLRDD